ncbi:MAG: AEC family transporter [Candidatus Sericytochromatia bacterium]
MDNFLLIAICVFAGVIFKKYHPLPKDAHKILNLWIIYVALPCVSLKYIPSIKWNYNLLIPILTPIFCLILGKLFIDLYNKFNVLDKKTRSVLFLTAALSNTSFIGFTLVSVYFGDENLNIAVICDQITFILLSSIGLISAIKAQEHEFFDYKKVIYKILKFPPFIGFVSAIVLPLFFNLDFFNQIFSKLAATTPPLALLSIGLQLDLSGWEKDVKHIISVVSYKLIFLPIILILLFYLLGFKGIISQVTLFEMAMPSLLSASVIISEYNLNVKLGNLIIGFSIVFCFITTFIWSYIIHNFILLS